MGDYSLSILGLTIWLFSLSWMLLELRSRIRAIEERQKLTQAVAKVTLK